MTASICISKCFRTVLKPDCWWVIPITASARFHLTPCVDPQMPKLSFLYTTAFLMNFRDVFSPWLNQYYVTDQYTHIHHCGLYHYLLLSIYLYHISIYKSHILHSSTAMSVSRVARLLRCCCCFYLQFTL